MRAARPVALPIPWVRLAASAAIALLAASAAFGAQAAWQSPIPPRMTLVGCGPAGPDSALGHFRFQIVDLNNFPVSYSHVVLDFHCCAGVALARDQRDPRLTVDCAARTVSTRADACGYASFTVMGTGTASPSDPDFFVWVYADGVLLGPMSVSVLERDGVGGLTMADLAPWAADYFRGDHPTRANFDDDLHVNLNDLAVWAGVYFGGADAWSAGPFCP